MRIIHTADWHYSDQNSDVTLEPLRFLVKEVHKQKPDVVVIAGDLFVKRGTLTPNEVYVVKNTILDMAEAAPVVIIPGNHDITNHYDRVDSVTGVFRWDSEFAKSHPRIYVANKYEVITVKEFPKARFYCLPHPSKYIYATNGGANGDMAKDIEALVRGIGVEAAALPDDHIAILVGHGTIAGGVSDSEFIMTAENDIAIDRQWLPDLPCMYGHLHLRQTVGNGMYCGGIAPFTYAQQHVTPSYEMWDILPDNYSHNAVEIPVSHQLLTIDIPATEFSGNGVHPMHVIEKAIVGTKVAGAKVRIRVEITEEQRSIIDRSAIEQLAREQKAHEVKVVLDLRETAKIRVDDIEPDLSMDTLLEKWTELDPARGKYLKDIKQINESVECLIPAKDTTKMEGTDYEIVQIRCKNFKPLIDVEVNFEPLGKIICITGSNHVGKSQLAEVERFALWKQLRKGARLSDVVRHGATTTLAEVEFNTRGKRYLVRRTVKLDGKGKAKADVALLVLVGDSWVSANEGTSSETDAAIESLVGTYRMYKSTRFGSQSEIDLLCNLSPSELTETLQESINIQQYDIRKGIAEMNKKRLQAKHDVAREKIESLQAELADEDDIKDQLSFQKSTAESMEGEIGKYQSQLAKAETRLAKVTTITEELTSLATRITAIDSKVKEHENLLSTNQKILDNKTVIKAGIERKEQLRVQIAELEPQVVALTDKMEAQIERRNHALDDLQAAKDEKASLQNRFYEVKHRLETAQSEYKSSCDMLMAKIDSHLKAAGLVDRVPCSGMDLQESCELLKNAIESKKIAKELQAEYESLEKPNTQEMTSELDEITKDISSVESRINDYGARFNKEDEGVTKAKTSLLELRERLESLRNLLKEEEAKGWEGLLARAETAQTENERLQKEIAELESEKSVLNQKRAKYEDMQAEEAELVRSINSLKASIEGIQVQRTDTLRRIGQLEAGLKQKQKIREEIESIEKAHRSGFREIEAYSTYISAMSRTGIPYLLLEKALPLFEKYANEFLCVDEGFETPLRVSISSTKQLLSGKDRDEVVITFVDDRGNHPLSEASGFQRVAIGYALRAAMAKLEANATGTVIRHCIFDEGWGASDPVNQLLGKRMIQKFGQEFHRFIYITHIPTLQEVSDTTINVYSVDGGAELTINQ